MMAWRCYSSVLHPTNIIFLIAIFLSCNCDAEQITFYEHSYNEGESITITQNGPGCTNLPRNWNDRISSVNTHNNCINVWEHGGCTGRSERIAPGTPYHNHLAGLGLNDEISSFQLCSGGGSPPAPPPSSGLSGVRRVAVDEHNIYRRRHRSPDIRGDNDEVHRTAQKYAEYLASNDKFEHSGNSKYGENLAGNGGGNEEEAVRNAVRMWYNEESKYDYNNPGFSMQTGHFTAVVWKSTTHVGIGVAWNPKRRWWVVVANYSPPGNFGGQYRENVLPPS